MFDVVQVGMGPVGLTMAALLAQAGHSVAVIERHEGLYGLPRASSATTDVWVAAIDGSVKATVFAAGAESPSVVR